MPDRRGCTLPASNEDMPDLSGRDGSGWAKATPSATSQKSHNQTSRPPGYVHVAIAARAPVVVRLRGAEATLHARAPPSRQSRQFALTKTLHLCTNVPRADTTTLSFGTAFRWQHDRAHHRSAALIAISNRCRNATTHAAKIPCFLWHSRRFCFLERNSPLVIPTKCNFQRQCALSS